MVDDLAGYLAALDEAEAAIQEAMSWDDVDGLTDVASSALVAALGAIDVARAAERQDAGFTRPSPH